MTQNRRWQAPKGLVHEGRVLDAANGFDVIECEVCGFKHIVPVPTADELRDIYQEEYYTIEKPLYFERHREDLEWWNMVYAERYEFFENCLPAEKRSILDVGSGPGFFLKLGKDRGWSTLGIEPSRQASDHARNLGLTIVNEFLNETNVEELGHFDVVHMHEVLEHIPDPAAMLDLAHRLLAPGGVLCVIVPNDYNPLQEILRRQGFKPWWVAPPHHVNYFDFASLQSLVSKVGFDAMHATATFPMELFLLMGDNYIGNDEVGRAMHAKRKNLEMTLNRTQHSQLKQQLYSSLADLKMGREIVLYASKPV